MKIVAINYEFLTSERERKIQQNSNELINTQKNLKMLNSGITKLDQILTMRQSNKHGLGYTETTNTVATTPKTVNVKAGVTSDVAITFKTVFVTAVAKTVNTPSSGRIPLYNCLEIREGLFLPTIFCNQPGHICSKCFEYQNIFKIGRFGKYNYNSRVVVYKPRNAPKHKIDLKTNHVKKIWVKKIRFKLLCCFYFLKDSFY